MSDEATARRQSPWLDRHLSSSYFFFGSCLWMGSVGCLGAFAGSTWRRRSSVPSCFFGLGPGLMGWVIRRSFLGHSHIGCNVSLAAAMPHLQRSESRA